MKRSPAITLTTDFGLKDGYVAAMKGVIIQIAPDSPIIDITHLIAPHLVSSGAYVLSTTYRCFPRGTIHLAVVDPGVGTQRAILAMHCDQHFFVGPDNGLFSLLLAQNPDAVTRRLNDLERWCDHPSHTFHGRDVFAPLAAHLAAGMSFATLGRLHRPQTAPWAEPQTQGSVLRGRIIHVDHFGNAVSNIRKEHLPRPKSQRPIRVILPDGMPIELLQTYGKAPQGAPLALMGSGNHLEIAINMGSAADRLGLAVGSTINVDLSWSEDRDKLR